MIINTLKELEQLHKKYGFVGITSLPPHRGTEESIYFMVIEYTKLNVQQTKWVGYRIVKNLYDYLTWKKLYKSIDLPEAL